MPSIHKDPSKLLSKITIATLLFVVIAGAILVTFQVKPFWVDEWFIICSLKMRNIHALFGKIAFMQQFPRVYLALIKYFTSFFNYSYYSLRLPSYLVSVVTIALTCRVMKKIWSGQLFTRYLFIMILVSSYTFYEYFVEMKQYPMDILMSVFALWQFIELLQLNESAGIKKSRYIFLCLSFLIVPFFSYTYPIAIAPAFIVVFLQCINIVHSRAAGAWRIVMLKWLPLLLGAVGICLFYIVDVRQLVTDQIMQERWSFLMLDDHHKFLSFLSYFYTFFSQLSAGVVFENLFGILGVISFIYGIVSGIRSYLKREQTLEMQLKLYSCIVITFALVLFALKKLPCNPRLNAFMIPSIAMLIIYFFNNVLLSRGNDLKRAALPLLLFIGVTGNVYSRYINYYSGAKYRKQLSIYTGTQKAIKLAQEKNLPILIAPGISYPYERAVIDAGDPDPAVWVLKTFPVYDVHSHIPVFAIGDTSQAQEYLNHLPLNITCAIAGDGVNYYLINRK